MRMELIFENGHRLQNITKRNKELHHRRCDLSLLDLMQRAKAHYSSVKSEGHETQSAREVIDKKYADYFIPSCFREASSESSMVRSTKSISEDNECIATLSKRVFVPFIVK